MIKKFTGSHIGDLVGVDPFSSVNILRWLKGRRAFSLHQTSDNPTRVSLFDLTNMVAKAAYLRLKALDMVAA
jgi:hypothetical protein